MDEVVIAYVPVLHRGYIDFFARHSNARVIYLLGRELCQEIHPKLRKDVRALDATEVAGMLKGLLQLSSTPIQPVVEVEWILQDTRIIMPDEELSHEFAERYLQGREVEFDNVFLRWDGKSSTKPVDVVSTGEVSYDRFDRDVMAKCQAEAGKSPDWWRQIGGCVIRDGELIMDPAYNEHVPSPIQPYFDGDPRADFSKGQNIEITTAFHIELRLIAEAARRGISLSGAHLYVTTFPCPWCAKAVAYSGISRVYFDEGYSVLDAESILKSQDVELIRVVTEEPPKDLP